MSHNIAPDLIEKTVKIIYPTQKKVRKSKKNKNRKKTKNKKIKKNKSKRNK